MDPANRLLARSPRFRLSSSFIRDSALAASGLLNDEVGGPPVYPRQPSGLWKEFSLERFAYKTSSGNSLHRRSLYTFWRRTVPPPNMFDSANRQTCAVKLSRTNTPLQALILLNDPTYVESFCFLASQIQNGFSDEGDEVKVQTVFERVVGRSPNRAETKALLAALQQSRQFFTANVESAREYVDVGDAVEIPESEKATIELAALSSLIQIVMNTDEFMTRE